jgi:hypothetical protein
MEAVSHPLATHMDGDTKTCPQCRQLLVFLRRFPFLNPSFASSTKGQDTAHQVRYAPTWVCTNPGCNYREFADNA